MKRITHINVFRQCLDCGYERFEMEEVKIGDNDQRTSSGFIICPKCNGCYFALVGYRDRRKALKDMNLPIVFGKTSNGEIVIRDLARLPHLLIGGLTGFGKSVFLNSLICSLVQNNPPEHIRFVLMDPKGVEFDAYAKLPHLYSSVIDKPEQCMTMLRYVEAEVERRVAMFGEKDVRDISDFKKHLVVVVDEFSDYIFELDDAFVSTLSRIAAIGGSAGVHLVLSTSRLDAKNVTDELKANIPSRLAFRVCRKIDSLALLDEYGAEDLLGRGDALLNDCKGALVRLQVPYIRDEAIMRIVESAIVRYPGRQCADGIASTAAAKEDYESMYTRALDLVRTTRRASTSWFQRQLNIGYNDALKVISLLEEHGVVGPVNDKGAREILGKYNSLAQPSHRRDGTEKREEQRSQGSAGG